MDNYMNLRFACKSNNESFARVAVASFVAQLDPTIEEITDIKTSVSEAVTNSIIHGYESSNGDVFINVYINGRSVTIEVCDEGKGISDIAEARKPLYTSKPDLERSGMGFTVMESFMDAIEVFSVVGEGTKVIMTKEIQG